jgi:hypothetical protein
MTTTTRLTRMLDPTDPVLVAAYERAFFQAFARATHNRLVRWLWEWDDAAGRLRTRIPYSHQLLWGICTAAGDVTDAIAVNVAMVELQSAAYGFAVPESLVAEVRAGRVCEFLTFFAVGPHALEGKLGLWRELFDDLRGLGFTHALGTCSPVVLPLYRWMGATQIGSAEIEQEKRIFLQFDLTRTHRRAR